MREQLSLGSSYSVFFHRLRRLLKVRPLHHRGLSPRPPFIHRGVSPPLHESQHWQHLLCGAATGHGADPPAAHSWSPRWRHPEPYGQVGEAPTGSRTYNKTQASSPKTQAEETGQPGKTGGPSPLLERNRSRTFHTQTPRRPGRGQWLRPGTGPRPRSRPADSAGPSPGPAVLSGRCLPREDG